MQAHLDTALIHARITVVIATLFVDESHMYRTKYKQNPLQFLSFILICFKYITSIYLKNKNDGPELLLVLAQQAEKIPTQ